MMGRQTAPAKLFYDFDLESHVPADHLLRQWTAGSAERKRSAGRPLLNWRTSAKLKRRLRLQLDKSRGS